MAEANAAFTHKIRNDYIRDQNAAMAEAERMAQRIIAMQARQFLADLKAKKRINAVTLDLENINISGLNRILTIEEQVEYSRGRALRTLAKQLNVLKDLGVSAEIRGRLEEQVTNRIDRQTDALRKQKQLQESFREGRHLLERFRLQRQGVILPGDQPTGFRQLLEERRNRTEQLTGLRDDKASPDDIREAETLVASLDSELRNLLSTANSVASVIGGAFTKAILTVMEKGGTIMDFLNNLKTNLKAVGEQMAFAFGQSFANAIQSLILGTGSVKQIIGSLIIALGNMAIAMGTILVLGSIFLVVVLFLLV